MIVKLKIEEGDLMSKSIWDTRFLSRKAVTFDEALRVSGWAQDADEDGDDWITINGAHVLVGANGEVKSGAGGKFTGTNYKEAREWAQTRKSIIEAQKSGEWRAGHSVAHLARTKIFHDACPSFYKHDYHRQQFDGKHLGSLLEQRNDIAMLKDVCNKLEEEGKHPLALKEAQEQLKIMEDYIRPFDEQDARLKKQQEEKEAKRREESEARKRERAETRKRERAEAREKKKAEARQKAEAKAKRESEARQRAEKEAREKAEAEARARREAETRQREEREAKEKAEREAKQREASQREGSKQLYKGVVDLSDFGVTDLKEFEKEAEELAKEDKEFAKVKREVDEKLSKLGSGGRRVRFVDRSEVPEGAKIGNYSDGVDVDKMANRILENSKKANLRNFDDFLRFMEDELSNPIPKSRG